jgi:hypothetical protein
MSCGDRSTESESAEGRSSAFGRLARIDIEKARKTRAKPADRKEGFFR